MLIVIVGVAVALIGYWPVLRSRMWMASAESAAGEVVDHVVEAPVVDFEVGSNHFRFVGSPSRSDPRLTVGATVEVRYDPDDPRQARLAGSPPTPASAWLTVGILAIAAGVAAAML
jgi:hypothetical protein